MLAAIAAALGKAAAVVAKGATVAGKAALGAAKGVGGAVTQVGGQIGQGIAQVAPQLGSNITQGFQVAGEGIAQGGQQAFGPLMQAGQAYLGQGGQALAAGPRVVNAPPIAYQRPNIAIPSSSSMTPSPIINTGVGRTGGGFDWRDFLSGRGGAVGTENLPTAQLQRLMSGDYKGFLKSGAGNLARSLSEPAPEAPSLGAAESTFRPYERPVGAGIPRGALWQARQALRRRPMYGGGAYR